MARNAKPNRQMNKLLNESLPYTIVAIHNHPYSSVPSLNDIATAVKRKYKYGIVVCHNGNIFKYKVNSEYNIVNTEIYLEKLNNIIYNRNYKDDYEKLFNECISKLREAGVELEMI
ncbi:MAG: hypothetical protein K2M73_10515 [Lachnospiraceae bacterium]|nr:hypothetical protein [Lachnospiraceae bacterium]